MYISKKNVSRRTALKGIGVSVALPLLDAMSPAATAWAQTAAGKTPKRLAFIGFPHGAIMDKWVPKQAGTDFEMSPILEPLTPFRKHLTIVSGLRNKPAETPEPHGYIEPTWLTCVKPWDFGAAGPDSGVSADQIAVRYIGQDTRLPSLELTTAQVGARLAWRTPTQSLPQEGNPAQSFKSCSARAIRTRNALRFFTKPAASWIACKGQATGCRPASESRTASSSAITSTRFAKSNAACRWRPIRTPLR
jgi:hypothetical protein